MKWTRYGPRAVMVTFADGVGPKAFARARTMMSALEAHPPPGLVEYVPGFTTLLLEFEASFAADLPVIVADLVQKLEASASVRLPAPTTHVVPVRYNGPDLERVASRHRLSTKEVQRLHTARTYQVYLLGFAPGFPYLGDLDERLHTPRLASPRPKVRAGSVGIGGQHTGIYSVDSPGGWNIIGHTDVRLFYPERCDAASVEEANMFLLKPGDRVRFEPCS
jgi:inhibitor of KinA